MRLFKGIYSKKQVCLLASLSVMVGILFPAWWILTFFGVSLFLYFLLYKSESLFDACAGGFIFGVVTAGSSLIWFWATLPIEWLPGAPLVQFGATGLVWLYVTFWLSLGTVFISALTYTIRNGSPIVLPFLLGILWALHELVRMLLYGFATYGEGSLPGAHFSISALGYALAENNYLLQYASFGGVYALSFALAFFASLLTLLFYFRKNHKKLFALSFLLFVFLIAPSYTFREVKSLSTPLTIGAVTLDATNSLPAFEVELDVLAFPESSLPENLSREKLKDTLLIFSKYNLDGSQNNGHITLKYELEGKTLYSYDKRFLMPLGEYVPVFTQILLKPVSNTTLLQRTENLSGVVSVGEDIGETVTFKGNIFGALLCSENLSPHLYTEFDAPDVLFNLSNTSWFHGDKRVMRALFTMSKVHAVQNNAYFVLASKGGYSFILNPKGEVLVKSTQPSEIIYATIK